MEAISENEVHDELMEELNIDPDCFKEIFADLSSGGTTQVSLKGAEHIFKAIGYNVPDEVVTIIKELEDMQSLNPHGAEEKARRFTALLSSIQTLYVAFSAEFSKQEALKYPVNIQRGDTDRAKKQHEANIADWKAARNYLRNLFYITSRASSISQSLMKAEHIEFNQS